MGGDVKALMWSGLTMIIGIIMIIISLNFVPDLVATTTTVLEGDPVTVGNVTTTSYDITNYIGLEPSLKVVPTFVVLGMLFTGVISTMFGGVMGARTMYRKARSK